MSAYRIRDTHIRIREIWSLANSDYLTIKKLRCPIVRESLRICLFHLAVKPLQFKLPSKVPTS